jgi:hypothetical protein
MFRILNIFNYFVLIICMTSQKCGPKNPTDKDSCLRNSNYNDNNVCCFASVSSLNKTNSEILGSTDICLLIPKDKIFLAPYLTQMDLGINNENLKMNIDCGNDGELFRAYQKCGPEFPNDFDDCRINSTPGSSCCYFKSPDGKSTCLLNPEISKQNKTMYGILVTCEGENLKLKLYKYLFLIIIMIILI